MLRSSKSRLKYMKMFQEYMNEYGDKYSEGAREYLEEHFLQTDDIFNTSDILLQIYGKFGLLPKRDNFYLEFTRIIGKKYGWNHNILEIGGGYYPIFSKYVSDKQMKKRVGSISVIDPKLVVDRLDNVKLYREDFTSDKDVSDFSLLIGISPCEATIDIVRSAIMNKKEFFVAMCGCVDSSYISMPFYIGYQTAYKYWVDFVYNLAREQEQDGFDVQKQYIKKYPYPIISSKKK